MKNQKQLLLGDCLDILKSWYDGGMREFIDLCYIDPPFNSNRNYNILFKTESNLTEEAFKDTWSDVSYIDHKEIISEVAPDLLTFLDMLEKNNFSKSHISYLTMMAIRCWYISQMLKPTGSFYYHCDPTMSHYIKIMLDFIFGENNFKNEIIWSYRRFSRTVKNRFPSMHDTILFYSKGKDNIYKPVKDELRGKGHIERGYHTVVDNGVKKLLVYNKEKAIQAGIDFSKYAEVGYVDGEETILNDVWELPILNPVAKERLGYPTQKPEKLLERFIEASSNPGDLVADFFLGGGTTIAVAERLNRNWIGCDINTRAIQITQKRLEDVGLRVKQTFTIGGIPKSSRELRELVNKNVLGECKDSRFDFQDYIMKYYIKNVHVIPNPKKTGDDSIDGRFTFIYKGKRRVGLVQVTVTGNKDHLKKTCAEITKGSGEMVVYVTFQDTITKPLTNEAKTYGKIGGVDKVQIISVEDLIDNEKHFELPKDENTILGFDITNIK